MATIHREGLVRSTKMTRHVLLAAAGVAAIAVGCGDDGDEQSSTTKPRTNAAAASQQTIEIASVPPAKLRFAPRRLTVKAGTYKVVLNNREAVVHNIRIQKGSKCCFKRGATDVGGTETTSAVEKISGTAKLAPGRYVFLCTVGGHWQRGMRGTITVQ
jgi:uncharacterized cupredoxin-like copper-binding protein